MRITEAAPAKLNLALHVRGKLPDGRHAIETIFAFCEHGDELVAQSANDLSLRLAGPFAAALPAQEDNLVLRAARALRDAAGVTAGAALTLDKRLPVASGVGGGSADAAATLRILSELWNISPVHATAVAPTLGSDVPACLLSQNSRGEGAGDVLSPVDLDLAGTPVLLVNPMVPLATGDVFARWDGEDHGELDDWRKGRNDLYPVARILVPQLGGVMQFLDDLRGCQIARMSGSGATCFAMFDSELARDAAASLIPDHWWSLATRLR